MSQLIESIKVLDNRIYNLSYHQQRVKESCYRLYGSNHDPINYNNIKKAISKIEKGLHKLRIVYNENEYEFSIKPYHLKPISTLKKVSISKLDYSLKFEERTQLNLLYQNRGKCDDILIIREGVVTDTYYANVAFLKNGNWFTPETPLLRGTQRQKLLDEEKLFTKSITAKEISSYSLCRLFNAMINFGEIEFSTVKIY